MTARWNRRRRRHGSTGPRRRDWRVWCVPLGASLSRGPTPSRGTKRPSRRSSPNDRDRAGHGNRAPERAHHATARLEVPRHGAVPRGGVKHHVVDAQEQQLVTRADRAPSAPRGRAAERVVLADLMELDVVTVPPAFNEPERGVVRHHLDGGLDVRPRLGTGAPQFQPAPGGVGRRRHRSERRQGPISAAGTTAMPSLRR